MCLLYIYLGSTELHSRAQRLLAEYIRKESPAKSELVPPVRSGQYNEDDDGIMLC